MRRVISATPLDGHCLNVCFDDGLRGTISILDRLFGPVFEPLRNEEAFRQVFVDEFGAFCWPNGADLAPDALHEQIGNEEEA